MHFNRVISSNKILYYYSTSLLIIANYVFLVILIVLNTLIYMEFKKLMENKKKMVSKVHVLIRVEEPSPSNKSNRINSLQTLTNNRINSLQADSALAIAASLRREREEKDSLRKTLIVTLWVSIVFSFDRFVKAINRTFNLIDSTSPPNSYSTAISYFCDVFVCSTYIFIYLRTNKMFKKQFYKIFLRRNI